MDPPAAFPLTFYNRRALYNERAGLHHRVANKYKVVSPRVPSHLSPRISVAYRHTLSVIHNRELKPRPFNLIDDYTRERRVTYAFANHVSALQATRVCDFEKKMGVSHFRE